MTLETRESGISRRRRREWTLIEVRSQFLSDLSRHNSPVFISLSFFYSHSVEVLHPDVDPISLTRDDGKQTRPPKYRCDAIAGRPLHRANIDDGHRKYNICYHYDLVQCFIRHVPPFPRSLDVSTEYSSSPFPDTSAACAELRNLWRRVSPASASSCSHHRQRAKSTTTTTSSISCILIVCKNSLYLQYIRVTPTFHRVKVWAGIST